MVWKIRVEDINSDGRAAVEGIGQVEHVQMQLIRGDDAWTVHEARPSCIIGCACYHRGFEH